jgi:hypothetical protein
MRFDIWIPAVLEVDMSEWESIWKKFDDRWSGGLKKISSHDLIRDAYQLGFARLITDLGNSDDWEADKDEEYTREELEAFWTERPDELEEEDETS